MNKISCDTCLDLIPLVKDGVASADSENLVLGHIQECDACREIYNGEKEIYGAMDDSIVAKKIRRNLWFFVITIILFGISVGIMITDSMNMFYNALIMPAIGGFGYLFLRKKAYYAPLAVFLFSVTWNLITNIADGFLRSYGTVWELAYVTLFMSGVYTLFSVIGLIITWSLCYAFKKED
ncbi:MAG TPA: zf-HC2 domain-containing protein [Clostridiales bacterium]|nr:zf-HC2 domain-containing protein [Clostridiales bacterium]